jgi:hypothetical protein
VPNIIASNYVIWRKFSNMWMYCLNMILFYMNLTEVYPPPLVVIELKTSYLKNINNSCFLIERNICFALLEFLLLNLNYLLIMQMDHD